jgi:hypothetical protein
MDKCSVPDCESDAVEGKKQCEDCSRVSERLASIWREKTEELFIEDGVLE